MKFRSATRTGAVVPLMAFVVSMLLIVLAVSINTNWVMFSQAREKSMADLASVSTLNHFSRNIRNRNVIRNSRDLGEEIVRLNGGGANQGGRIKFGRLSDLTSHEPTFIEDENSIEAVQVEFDDTNKVPLFMGNLLSKNESTISAEAVSVFQTVEVVLAIDASRSMNRLSGGSALPPGVRSTNEPPIPGSRWFALVDAMREFLTAVRDTNPNARIALVTFGGGQPGHRVASPLDATEARLELSLRNINSSNQFINLVESYKNLPALGLGTYISTAIDISVDELLSTRNVRAKRFIILLSDGNQATFGTPAPRPSQVARRAAANEIEIHTINFQQNANPELLRTATVTGGDSFDATDVNTLRAAFRTLLEQFNLRLAR